MASVDVRSSLRDLLLLIHCLLVSPLFFGFTCICAAFICFYTINRVPVISIFHEQYGLNLHLFSKQDIQVFGFDFLMDSGNG